VLHRRGPYLADQEFADVVAHIATNCNDCIFDLREMVTILAADSARARLERRRQVDPARGQSEDLDELTWRETSGPFHTDFERLASEMDRDQIEGIADVSSDQRMLEYRAQRGTPRLTIFMWANADDLSVAIVGDEPAESTELTRWRLRVQTTGGQLLAIAIIDEAGRGTLQGMTLEDLEDARVEVALPS
jgi:hypothetical protein